MNSGSIVLILLLNLITSRIFIWGHFVVVRFFTKKSSLFLENLNYSKFTPLSDQKWLPNLANVSMHENQSATSARLYLAKKLWNRPRRNLERNRMKQPMRWVFASNVSSLQCWILIYCFRIFNILLFWLLWRPCWKTFRCQFRWKMFHKLNSFFKSLVLQLISSSLNTDKYSCALVNMWFVSWLTLSLNNFFIIPKISIWLLINVKVNLVMFNFNIL